MPTKAFILRSRSLFLATRLIVLMHRHNSTISSKSLYCLRLNTILHIITTLLKAEVSYGNCWLVSAAVVLGRTAATAAAVAAVDAVDEAPAVFRLLMTFNVQVSSAKCEVR
ncbi:unnamed protein product [Calypogeia fissa]